MKQFRAAAVYLITKIMGGANMKRILAVTMVLMLVLAAGCAAQPKHEPETSPEPTSGVGMANPWTEYATLEEAEEAAGVSFPQPKWDVSYDTVSYRAMAGVIEIVYSQDDGQVMTLRKGADESDISGDYNDYDFTSDFSGAISGKIQGITNEQGEQLCKTAMWVFDGHFYVIFVELSETTETMMETIQLINDAQG